MRPIRGSERTRCRAPATWAKPIPGSGWKSACSCAERMLRRSVTGSRARARGPLGWGAVADGVRRTSWKRRRRHFGGEDVRRPARPGRCCDRPARRTVILAGTVAQFNSVFGVELLGSSTRTASIGAAPARSTCPTKLAISSRRSWASTTGRKPVRIFAAAARPRPSLRRATTGATGAAAASTAFTPEATWPNSTISLPAPPARTSVSRSSSWVGDIGRPTSRPIFPTTGSIPRRRSPPSRWTTPRTRRPESDSADGEVMLDIEVVGSSRQARHRGLFRAQHRRGLHRRRDHCHARHHQQAIGHLDQLGRAGVSLDRPGDDRPGRACSRPPRPWA